MKPAATFHALAGATAFAALALAGETSHAQGAMASPRGSAKGTVDGATVTVDYGRPSARGRKIMGELVPWGQVWRTGANEATHLVTDRDLVIGGTNVPAGRYTLYTLPGEREWTLIINKQTGQWGTEYDQGQDLARIPMQIRQLSAPVETLTVAVAAGQPSGGVLQLSWESTEASVPFTVRAGSGVPVRKP